MPAANRRICSVLYPPLKLAGWKSLGNEAEAAWMAEPAEFFSDRIRDGFSGPITVQTEAESITVDRIEQKMTICSVKIQK